MQPNIHNPQRLKDETFANYKVRRAASQRLARQSAGWHHQPGDRTSRQLYRSELRRNGAFGKRLRFAAAICGAAAQRRAGLAEQQRMRAGLPGDSHGAYTLTGGAVELIGITPQQAGLPLHVTGGEWAADGQHVTHGRRIWLAGISAQRGY